MTGLRHHLALALLIALPSAIPAQQTADTLTLRLQLKHGVGATALAISPDSKVIATASYLLVDSTGRVTTQLRPSNRVVGEAKLWNAQTGALVRTLTIENDKIASLAFSPDGNLLAAGGGNVSLPHRAIRITVWDLRSGAVNRTLDAYDEDVANVSFLGDSDGLVAIGYTRAPNQKS